MFQEVKGGLPVSGDGYDAQIIQLIKAAVKDLTATAEITLDGVVDITREQQTVTVGTQTQTVWVITDNSTIEDELAITAITAWVNMHLFNPPNYDNLAKSYNAIKGSMRLSGDY